MLTSSNNLLRSVYQIAKREGKNTNWKALEKSLREELLIQAGTYKENTDAEILLRVTCTAKTYRTNKI